MWRRHAGHPRAGTFAHSRMHSIASRRAQIFMYVHGYSASAQGSSGGGAMLPGQTTTPVTVEEMALIKELKLVRLAALNSSQRAGSATHRDPRSRSHDASARAATGVLSAPCAGALLQLGDVPPEARPQRAEGARQLHEGARTRPKQREGSLPSWQVPRTARDARRGKGRPGEGARASVCTRALVRRRQIPAILAARHATLHTHAGASVGVWCWPNGLGARSSARLTIVPGAGAAERQQGCGA